MRAVRGARGIRALLRVETLLLALAIAILVGVSVLQRAPREPASPLDSYSSYDAGSGGYRALYELLAREGVRLERFELPPALLADAAIAKLVYVEPLAGDPRAHDPSRADVAALEAWVRGGGALLYIGFDDAAARAGILGLPRLARGAAVANSQLVVAPELRALGIVRVASDETRRFALRRGMRALLGDRAGAVVVAYRFGRGTVTAAIDRGAFADAGLAAGDRARLAFALARPLRPADVVAFDEVPHGYAAPEHWWSIVPRPFAIALAGALAALLIALGGAALRLGPPLIPVPRDDRSSADFVDAVASLYERRGDVRGTLVEATASTARALARSRGLAADATNDEIAAHLERDDVRASFLALARIATNGYPDSATLVCGVALAQQLRKDLTAHGGSRT